MRMYVIERVTQAYSEKENPSASIRSQTDHLPITISVALSLSYRRLVGAKAIKKWYVTFYRDPGGSSYCTETSI